MTPKKPKLKWRPYGNRIYANAAQDAMTHFRGWTIHREMYPETKQGGRGNGLPMRRQSPICYTKYAAASCNLPQQYVRDLVRIGRYVPEDFLLSVVGTELDQFMFLLNIATLTEEFKNEKHS